jgi:hypothetical protein
MKKNNLIMTVIAIFGVKAITIAQTCAPSVSVNGSVTTVNFNATGLCTWTVPAGATNLFIETWGAGGNGGSAGSATVQCPKKGGGGGGGAYARATSNISPGTVLNVLVGSGGTITTGSGGPSEVYSNTVSYVRATGGGPGGSVSNSQSCFNLPSGGIGGTVQAGVGFSGGLGQQAQATRGGTGGGSANSGSAGGSGASGGNAGSVAPPSSGGGSAGGFGSSSGFSNGGNGESYGGGGGGGYSTTSSIGFGGSGAEGHVRITYCNSIFLPTFNTVSPICAGQTLSPLPTTSINGISGSWSPAINNLITTTYTFTPSSSCASTATLTITVNPAPTQPTTACYETATFNTATCQWDVTGSPASISQPTNQIININNNAQFVVSSSDPNATYQWQTDLSVGFQNLNNVGQFSGTTTNTLTVSNATLSNNNQPFRCIISSGSCTDESDVAILTVNNILGINETSQDKLFSVFPNPAQSEINVKVDSKIIGSVYTIYNNRGRVVLSGKINSENTTIELGNLSVGVYMFSFRENMKQTFKIIKE